MIPTICGHPDWEYTGTGFKCKATGCGQTEHLHAKVTIGAPVLAAGSTSPVAATPTAPPWAVLYMAHPVAGDVPANLARAKRWLRWLRRAMPDAVVVAPWLHDLEVLEEDDNDPHVRATGLRRDCAVVSRCDGLVLVGGRVSSGMREERDTAEAQSKLVLDLTGMGNEPPGEWR